MKRILLIDDEADLLEEVAEWLMLEGYEIESAGNGMEGIQLAFRNTPDLIICDVTMPELDGYGVLLELRANPSTVTVPFIFVTARASHEDIRKGMSLGADDYLTKPFTRLELLQGIEARLEKQAIQNEVLQDSVRQWRQAFEDEHEQRLLKAKLIAMFSHDFRNPLAIIASAASVLRNYSDRIDAERRQKHLDRVLSSVRQLNQMLDEMLTTSQIETGHLRCEPRELNLTQFLYEIVEDFQSIHQEKHDLVFRSEIAEAIMLDPRLLTQIASNLISNAIKYSPDGGHVWVKAAVKNSEFILSVQDEGIGIPDSEQEKLFNAFQRASNVGAIAGTGLGLAIVKQSVDLHQGTISLESQLHLGTTITVRIPCNSNTK